MVGRAAKRYARAFFELAQGADRVDRWGDQLAQIREVLRAPELRDVLTNPSIDVRRRQEVVGDALRGRVDAEGVNLTKLLVAARRVADVDAVAEEYGRLADEAAGRVRATATSAVELTPEQRERLARDLSANLGKDVRLQTRVDPAVLGGLVVQVGDRVIDASAAGRLRQLRGHLLGQST
jgi:F-type H+-transporting ATPase subunit delta